MKRSLFTMLMVAVLVLPTSSMGIAQESLQQAVSAAPSWGPAGPQGRTDLGETRGLERRVAAFAPTVPTSWVILVTTTDDELNSDGDCSLREAIQSANTDTLVDGCTGDWRYGDDWIDLPSGTYTLTIPGAGEDSNQTGDLDILDDMTIGGYGADTTVIGGKQLDRVLDILPGRTVEVRDLTVADGYVLNENGGGIRVEGSDLTLNGVILRNNTVHSMAPALNCGGGLSTEGRTRPAATTLNNSRVISNTASGTACGGGLGNEAYANITGALTLNNSTVRGNRAVSFGGGIASLSGVEVSDSFAIVTIHDSTVSGNTVSGDEFGHGLGGGLFLGGTQATIVNSTVSGNSADGSGMPNASGLGGGILVFGYQVSATLTLINTTVADNISEVGGGGVANVNFGAEATTSFGNSLFGGNTAPAGFGESCYSPDLGYGQGTLISLGHNLEDHDQCEFDQPTDQPNTDPLLGPLADNGGDTETHALLWGSQAIDAGDDTVCPCMDQRGVPRPQGTCSDIGSYEALCGPVDQISVEGPTSLYVNTKGIYTASHAPLTATLPVGFAWDNGSEGVTAVYSWTLPGSYTFTVTATNPCGEAVGSFAVEVDMMPYRVYLPLVVRSE